MDVKKAEKYMGTQLEALEKASYYFENIAKPRYEQDMMILKKLRDDLFKLKILIDKRKAGEVVSDEEFHNLVPLQFR